MNFSRLIAWWKVEARTFPWSGVRDPYKVWISEIMLQQTVASAVIPHFSQWMDRWPNLRALAAASEDEVLRQWEGLGYYSRARNLLRSARVLTEAGYHNLPNVYSELRKLPGVGDYTASAVLSFALEQSYLTLDANVRRILQRLSAAEEWSTGVEDQWRREFQELWGAKSLTSRETNLALMQVGQQICRPRNPLCEVCPLASQCRALELKLQSQIPAPKTLRIQEVTSRVLIRASPQGLVMVRPTQGRFSNLWRFPLGGAGEFPGPPEGSWLKLSPRVHTYTRYREFLDVWGRYESIFPETILDWAQDFCVPKDQVLRVVSWEDAEKTPMPSVYRKIFEEWKNLVRKSLDR